MEFNQASMKKLDHIVLASSLMIYSFCYLNIFQKYSNLYNNLELNNFYYYNWSTFMLVVGILPPIFIVWEAVLVSREKHRSIKFNRWRYLLAYFDGTLINLPIYLFMILYFMEKQPAEPYKNTLADYMNTFFVVICALINNLFYPMALLD